jgi:glycosyltransferase involved in cell wall biosynthesis
LGPTILLPGYIPDDDLPALYSGAIAFAYPSLYEGFGMPVLEALACGTPVLTSDTSSMPEVAGAAALLVDPTSVDAIAEGLSAIMSSDPLRDDLRRRGLARARQFDWRKTAQETAQVYRRASEGATT